MQQPIVEVIKNSKPSASKEGNQSCYYSGENPRDRTEVPGKEKFDLDTENPTDDGNLDVWVHEDEHPVDRW